jgi:hypothetical protein
MIWCLIVVALLLVILNFQISSLCVSIGRLHDTVAALKESSGETNDLLRETNNYLVTIDAAMPGDSGDDFPIIP